MESNVQMQKMLNEKEESIEHLKENLKIIV